MVQTFNKLHSLTSDERIVIESLKNSTSVCVSPDEKRVKRIVPFVSTADPSAYDHRTVYAENLPENYSHDSIKEMFSNIGPVSYVSLPKYPDKSLKGYAFIEFETEEDAQKAVSQLDKFNEDKEKLRVMTKTHWLEYKKQYKQFIQADKIIVHRKQPRPKPQKKEKPKKEEKKPARKEEAQNREEVVAERQNVMQETEKVVRISGMKDGVTKVILRNTLEDNFPLLFINYKAGNVQCEIHVKLESEAQELASRRDDFSSSLGPDVTIRVLTGEEEKVYWEKSGAFKKFSKDKKGGRGETKVNEKKEVAKKRKVEHAQTEKPKRQHIKFDDDEEEEVQ
ncbi:la-related protein 7 [Planoprotostelium fungivorum]|uniref:La-related protein 7 n=1 Tax=Planoprotostelium fungivorum TaxID=1890364 RepID=A0A2P6NQ32_9EUKA|nr:la-related protein 7 [Planoprotostelium fungivorum]